MLFRASQRWRLPAAAVQPTASTLLGTATHPSKRVPASTTTWNSEQHPDILDWADANRSQLLVVNQLRWAETKGVVHYTGVASAWLLKKLTGKNKEVEQTAVKEDKGTTVATSTLEEGSSGSNPPTVGSSSSSNPTTSNVSPTHTSMEQYHQSRELCNTFKWKRVTWDADADFDAFSQRTLDAHALGYFASVPAMSHLCIHLVADGRHLSQHRVDAGRAIWLNAPSDYRAVQGGTLTAWALHEGATYLATTSTSTSTNSTTSTSSSSSAAANVVTTDSPPYRAAPFTVLWEQGEVRMRDTASPSDLLTFLERYAARLQRIQLDHAEEQETITEMVEQVRFRCSLVAVRYNGELQMSSRAEMSPEWMKLCGKDAYVNPDDILLFCRAMLATAWLFRSILKGHVVRILPRGAPFHIDVAQREVHIPCDFARYHHRAAHRSYLRHEGIANLYRTYWFVWLLLGCGILGDLDVV